MTCLSRSPGACVCRSMWCWSEEMYIQYGDRHPLSSCSLTPVLQAHRCKNLEVSAGLFLLVLFFFQAGVETEDKLWPFPWWWNFSFSLKRLDSNNDYKSINELWVQPSLLGDPSLRSPHWLKHARQPHASARPSPVGPGHVVHTCLGRHLPLRSLSSSLEVWGRTGTLPPDHRGRSNPATPLGIIVLSTCICIPVEFLSEPSLFVTVIKKNILISGFLSTHIFTTLFFGSCNWIDFCAPFFSQEFPRVH